MASGKKIDPKHVEAALAKVTDESSFIQTVLIDLLHWPIDPTIKTVEEIAYDWTKEELRAANLDKKVVEGRIRQLALPDCPWGIFIVEFAETGAFRTVLRQVLRGLVPNRRRDPRLKAWQQKNLLFICTTRGYDRFTFAHFRGDKAANAKVITFGWRQGDSHVRTLCEFNLPALSFPGDNGADPATWLAKWSAAFDVEAVTKRFFAEYAEVFTSVENSVQGVPKGEPRRLYTQRLFNRLMFLYFIQRKGWLSFQGDKKYLRALFNAASAAKEDFLNDRLYWTFFAGLNTINEDAKLHKNVDLKERRGEVPFLNGGLFDLEDDYDVRGDVTIPNKAFAAVMELFERYNFTVTESTPLDIEVAVDPEMLGKVFEELVTGRHETGSYYTPRPIVAFMCREALKHYLATASSPLSPLGRGAGGEGRGPTEAAIARFVDDGDPSNLADPEAVLNSLRSVKVCDPACGSGAYLLGMMQELLRLREALFATRGLDSVTVYKRKLDIIQNNLYGVDIDVFAVNIAKLRLWLSLAVDFEGTTPPPLPNLDFKIECGDSVTAPDPQDIPDLFRNLLVKTADQLADLKAKYLSTYGAKKKKLVERIQAEEAKLRGALHEEKSAAVDWRVAFAEVFRNGGFDVIVANPPYVRQELIKALKPALKNVYQALFAGTADLYVFFYLRGLQLLAPGGMLVYISSNKWFRAAYGQKLRAHIAKTTTVQTILDFHDLPVFEAIAYPMIFIAKKQPPTDDHTAILAEPPDLDLPYPDVKEVVEKYGHAMPKTALGRDGTWNLSHTAGDVSDVELRGTPLVEIVGDVFFRGVMSGLNEAFVIDDATRASLIAESPSAAKHIKPLVSGRDVKKWVVNSAPRYLLFITWNYQLSSVPSIERHLRQFAEALKSRPDVRDGHHKWWCLSRYSAGFEGQYEKPKIMFPDIAPSMRFAYDSSGKYGTNTTYSISADDPFLVAVLNSTAVAKWYEKRCARIRGGYLRFYTQYVEQIPIPDASAADRFAIAALAQKCLDAKGLGCEAWEKEIDERVAALYGLDAADLGDNSSRPVPFYDTKGHLVHRVIPKLAKATPGFPYFSLDAIKAELEKHRGGAKPESLNHYMHELTGEGVVYDAGRGWYSTLSVPLTLDREPVRELVETLQNRFPFLEFSCWSTKQVAAYGHHQLARFTSFVYAERDAMESVADALRETGQTVFVDPGKALIGKSVKLSDGAIVVRPLVTRAPVDGHFALAEKVLVDLFKESDDLKLMDSAEFEKIIRNAISSCNASISAILAYAVRRNASPLAWVESINAKLSSFVALVD